MPTTDKTTKKKLRRSNSREVIPQADLQRMIAIEEELKKLDESLQPAREKLAAAQVKVAPEVKKLGAERELLGARIFSLVDKGARTEDGDIYPEIEITPGGRESVAYKPWLISTVDTAVQRLSALTPLTRITEIRQGITSVVAEVLRNGGAALAEHLSEGRGYKDDTRKLVLKKRS